MENKTILLIAAAVVAFLVLTSPSKNVPATPDNINVAIPKNNTTENITANVKLNYCGYEHYGYANYVGTEKENLTCADAWPDQQNAECILNAPVNFDGSINKLNVTSDPRITCCVGDGTCQWLPRSK